MDMKLELVPMPVTDVDRSKAFYVEKLNEVNTDGVEPMTRIVEEGVEAREDVVGPMLTQAEALKNAPKKVEGFFSVPKVLGDAAE